MGHVGDQAQHDQNGRGNGQRAGRAEHLVGNLLAGVVVLAHARDHHGRCHRDQQCRNLCHQRVTHGQQDVAVGRIASAHAVLCHADDETAHDGDDQNQDTGHGVATHKLGGTVHGAEEVRLFLHFCAAALGFCFINQAGVQIGVHGHLLAGHGVQGKAGRHFGNTLCTLGNHHKVDHHQNGKHDQTHGKVAANQKVAKGLNHLTGCAGAGVAFQQHHAGGGHVQRQAHQGGEQQHRGESRKVQRLDHVGGNHHHHQRGGDVQREEGVQQPWWHGQHHEGQDGNDQHGRSQILDPHAVLGVPVLEVLQECSAHGAVLSFT